jgi:hypothetical protein
MNTAKKTVVFWISLLVFTVIVYQTISRTRASGAVLPDRIIVTKKVEYSIAPVGVFTDDLRAVLASKGNEGWELAAPVVNNGTTTALIFKRERK